MRGSRRLAIALRHKQQRRRAPGGRHVTSAIVWALAFGIHLLLHGLDVLRSLRADWKQTLLRSAGGAGARAPLLASSLGAGLALAWSLLGAITGWHGE